ncbi:uncharacterized protein LOC124167263 [Ischnura elegans]|uniref:uncharacterized protein LOC124167263 n=1 Tax=Ischnura elegans TaxID=197161 RepID=UPI001ED87F43|nr:uncharacterized protein LOC124167263 [Ischnura elegans]
MDRWELDTGKQEEKIGEASRGASETEEPTLRSIMAIILECKREVKDNGRRTEEMREKIKTEIKGIREEFYEKVYLMFEKERREVKRECREMRGEIQRVRAEAQKSRDEASAAIRKATQSRIREMDQRMS